MKITKLNFKYLYPKISKVLAECDFVSFDLEFSGTSSKKELVNTRFDDVNFRYFKLKENTKNFLPLQVGLCGMKINSGKISLFPMNFYIFPHLQNDDTSKKYLFDIGSINFLTSNFFDFNKTFYDGLRYISLSEYHNNRRNKSVKDAIKSKREEKHFPPEARIFTISLYPSLKKFIDKYISSGSNFDYTHPDNLIEFEITHVRRIMLEYFLSNVNSLFKIEDKPIMFEIEVDESSLSKTILKLKITNTELLQEKSLQMSNEKNYKKVSSWFYYQAISMCEGGEDVEEIWKKILMNVIYKNLDAKSDLNLKESIEKYLQSDNNSLSDNSQEIKNIFQKTNIKSPLIKELMKQILDLNNVENFYNVGFTKVIADLIKNKKNMIFHNGILDLIHLVDKFIEPIPETFDEFAKSVNKYFPKGIYDTKYIIDNNSALFGIFPDSSLETVYKKISSEGMLNDIRVEVDEDFRSADYNLDTNLSNNNNNIKSHEAGYDSMITSYVFIFIFKHLFKNPYLLSEINNITGPNESYVRQCLEIFKNKLLFSGLQIACDLNINTTTTTTNTNSNKKSHQRFEIYVLTSLPELITPDELKNCFKGIYGFYPHVYKLFGQNIAYFIFTKSWEEAEFLKRVHQNDIGTGVLTILPIDQYKTNSPVISYTKFKSTLESDSSIEKILNEMEVELI
jgi:hypothetical protein